MKEKEDWEIFQTLGNNKIIHHQDQLWSLKNKSKQSKDWQLWDSPKLKQLKRIWHAIRMKNQQQTYCSTDWPMETLRWNSQNNNKEVAEINKVEVINKAEIKVIRNKTMMTTYLTELIKRNKKIERLMIISHRIIKNLLKKIHKVSKQFDKKMKINKNKKNKLCF